MQPNQMQLLSTVRTVLMFLAGTTAGTAAFHAIGVTPDTTTIGVIAGIVVGIGTYVWSLISHTKQATVARAADIVPVSAAAQASVGITQPQTIPSNPPK